MVPRGIATTDSPVGFRATMLHRNPKTLVCRRRLSLAVHGSFAGISVPISPATGVLRSRFEWAEWAFRATLAVGLHQPIKVKLSTCLTVSSRTFRSSTFIACRVSRFAGFKNYLILCTATYSDFILCTATYRYLLQQEMHVYVWYVQLNSTCLLTYIKVDILFYPINLPYAVTLGGAYNEASPITL